MKRFYQILAVSLLATSWASAQTATNSAAPEKSSFTLDECISYALANQVAVKNARIDSQISEAKVKETIGIGLPQITGSVGVQHNPKLPRFYSTYYADQEGFIPPEALPADIQNGDVFAAQNFFQLPSNGNAGVTINQLLFNSSYLVGLKASSTYKELAYKTEEQTQIEVVQGVTKAYYAVLVNNERITLFEGNIARVDSLLRTTAAMNKNGFSEAIDVDRIQVTLNNLKSERLKFLNIQSLTYGLLKFQMNYPMEKDIEILGGLADLKVNENLFNEYQDGWDYKNRIEYKILDTQRRLQELDLKNKYSQSLPSLVGFANLGYSTQSPNIAGVFKTESRFTESAAIGRDKWYGYSTIGVSLNIPIFTGLQHTYQQQQSRLQLLKLENSYVSLKQSIDLSIDQNTTTYKNSLETFRSQRENMELAERVARVTKIKYEQGVGSNIEVTDAENSLREAQVNYYNALYDAIVSKVDLDKAYAKIDPSKYPVEQPANNK